MKRLLTFLQSPAFRRLLLILALGAAVWGVVIRWDDFSSELLSMSFVSLFLILVTSILYVAATMLSWRMLLNDTGESISVRLSSIIFFVSQLTKYLPGGVWNFLAAAEEGARYQISRRRSFTVLLSAVAVSIGTGAFLSTLLLLSFSPSSSVSLLSIGLLFVGVSLCLTPPVFNRLITRVFRLLKKEPLERPLTWKGLFFASTWSLVAWGLAGAQVWIILTALGMPQSIETFTLATGGYALAWTAGFMVFFVPAGLGVREAVLGGLLAHFLTPGTILVAVVVSRVMFTCADIFWGLGSVLLSRFSSRAETVQENAP